jgi:hypothetical protein
MFRRLFLANHLRDPDANSRALLYFGWELRSSKSGRSNKAGDDNE